MITTTLAVLSCLLVTIGIHAEGLSSIIIEMARLPVGERLKLIIVVSSAIFLHVIEIGFYAMQSTPSSPPQDTTSVSSSPG